MCLLALHSSSSVFAVELLSIQPSSWEHSSGHSTCIKLVEFVCMHVCSDQSLNAWCAWSMLAIAILRCYGCCLELFTMNICTYVCSIVVESLLALYMKLDHWIGGVTSAFCVDMFFKRECTSLGKYVNCCPTGGVRPLLVSENLTDQARRLTKQGGVASHCQVEILEFTMKYCTALASAKHTAENPL